MPRETTVREASRRPGARRPQPPAEALPRTPLCVVDVALLHGERSSAIRAYPDAKAAWAQRSGLIEHHVIVPAAPSVTRGAHETFGLVGLEAAASGASVVTCSTAPSAALMRGTVRTYEPGDIDGLPAAIERGLRRAAGPRGGRDARQAPCATAFGAETLQLERLTGRRPPRLAIAG